MSFRQYLGQLAGLRGFQPEEATWEAQYQQDQWQHLRQLGELAHYNVIRGYFNHYCQGGSILDVGCGEGVLQRELSPNDYSYYQGIDFSTTAIARAMDRQANEKTFFAQADAHQYQPDRKFDCIVFCESLNCINGPELLVNRLHDYLKPNGVIIVSLFRQMWIDQVMWMKIQKGFTTLDKTLVRNGQGKGWQIKVLKRP